MKTFLPSVFIALILSWTATAAPPEPPAWSGVLVDDEAAEYTGKWIRTATRSAYVGKTYHHDDKNDPTPKSARFTPDLPKAGQYEVRLLYVAHPNRATNVSASIFSDDGETKRIVNRRENPLIGGVPRALGVFRFAAGKKGSVLVSTQGADGFVVVDAVQFVPLALAEAERAAVKPLLAEPRRVHHTASSPAHLRVEWEDVANNEAGYRIWRREVGGAWYLAGETRPNATHFDDGGMQERTAYEHKVAAFNASGEGSPAITDRASSTSRMEPHLKSEILFAAGGKDYPRNPAAVELKSGELLLAFDLAGLATRKKKAERDDRLCLIISRERRQAWSEPRTLLARDKSTIHGKPALVRLANGRLGMSFSSWTLNEKGAIASRERHFMTSDDEGQTWSKAVPIGPLSASNHTLTFGNGGRLLESLSDTSGVNDVFASDDQGASWRSLGRVPGKRLGEASLAHVGNNQIVFLSRHEWPFYRLSFSADNGATWESKESLLYLGGGDNPPKVTLLPDGKTLVAIVHSWYPGKKAKDRRQLASVISRDGGRSWDNFRLIGFAPEGDDGFQQPSITFVGDTTYQFYGGGSRNDANDGKDLRLIRLSNDFFTSTTPWPYDCRGQPLK